MNSGLANDLGQADILSPVQRGVRDHFQTGGSIVSVFLVVLTVVLMVAAAYAISKIIERPAAGTRANNPLALFGSLLERLGVNRAQRKLLEQVAREQSLSNPSMLLLSPAVFETSFHKWQSRRTPSPNSAIARETAAMISATKKTLFPTARLSEKDAADVSI